QMPLTQWSFCVQALPSLQRAPSGAARQMLSAALWEPTPSFWSGWTQPIAASTSRARVGAEGGARTEGASASHERRPLEKVRHPAIGSIVAIYVTSRLAMYLPLKPAGG